MKNRGVTSPPLKPLETVMVVNRIFKSQLQGWAPPSANEETMVTTPGWAEVTPRPR